MKPLGLYVLVGAGAIALVIGGLALVLPPDAARGVAWMGVAAWVVQSMLFAPLLAARGRRNAFFVAWGGGTLIRLLAIGIAAWWLYRSGALPLAPSLLALAGFLFLLLLLEPVFFRLGLRSE